MPSKKFKMNKILLVEDDYNLGLMICELLELNGY